MIASDWLFKTLVAAAFTVVFGLSAWAGKTTIEDGNRLTRLEAQRAEDVERLKRIEAGQDRIEARLVEARMERMIQQQQQRRDR
jgi:cell division protein FtsB